MMMSKRRTTTAGVAVLSLLLLGLVPVFAQSTQPNPADKAATIIQVATAARGYVEQLIGIAQQHQVNTTKAESLVAQGDPLLAKAQSEVSTNATLAIKDAMGAIQDYHGAAQALQYALVGPAGSPPGTDPSKDKLEYLKQAIERARDKVALVEAMLDKVCGSQTSASKACSDARADLAVVKSDLDKATDLLASKDPDPAAIAEVLKDAMQHFSAVFTDLKQIADDHRIEKAVDYIQNVLEKQLAKLQDAVAKLDPSVAAQYKAQLDKAQSLLTQAIQDFKSGNFDAGTNDAKQAVQIMQQIIPALQSARYADYAKEYLQPKLNQLKDMAAKANLPPSVAAQVQSQLAQAQSLLDGAVKSFLSGDLKGGQQQIQQLLQLMQQIYQEITGSAPKP